MGAFMKENTVYIPKTKDEINALSSDALVIYFNEMMVTMQHQKQKLKDIFAIDTANLDVMTIAADAVIDAMQNSSDQELVDKYDLKYKNALKNVTESTDLRRHLMAEAKLMAAEINTLAEIAATIEDGGMGE